MLKDFRFKKNHRGFSEKTFRFMRKTIIPVTKYLFRPRITNPEYMPLTGPCFIYGNHAHYFDPFFLNVGMTREPTAGVMTRDQFHKTIPRIFMDSIGIVPTSKYVPEPGIVRSVIKMIEQERMIVIFPEGGRRWDGRPKSLIETTLKLFWKMKIPVHPVQIHGSYLAWPRWADNFRSSSVELRFLKPLHASNYDDYETFADVCRKKINFKEYTPPEGAFPKSCLEPASGIQRFLYRCPNTGVTGAVYSPDGEMVYSRESGLKYRMNVASRLIDYTGKQHSIIDMFDHINQMPMEFIKDDLLLEKHGSQIYEVNKEHQRIKRDRAIVELRKDRLVIYLGSENYTITLEDLRYISVEQNHKITVTTPENTFQIDLKGDSALQWQIYINRLKIGEKPVKSL